MDPAQRKPAHRLGIGHSYCLSGEVGGARRLFRIRSGANTVGSRPSNSIVLPTHGVSREHAEIHFDNGRLWVRDRGSTNGTFVNGERVAEAPLAPGDRVGLGPLDLEVVWREGEDLTLAFSVEPGEGIRPPAESGEEPTEPLPSGASPSDLVELVVASLDFPEDYVVGRSEAMAALYRQLLCLLHGPVPVLLLGETGVGKEHLALILHRSSARGKGPYVALNCAAIPAELLETEMFGIASGVATGVTGRPGRFQQAHGGTLFLDEIDGMPTALQAKLLRAIETSEVRPVGGALESLDVRIVAAANGDLPKLIEQGVFRRDLYYRLAGYELRVPPLRERWDDIPALVEHFVRHFCAETGRAVQGMSLAAVKELVRRAWPGNVRELRNEVRRLVYFCPDGEVIRQSDLPAVERTSSVLRWVEDLVDEDGRIDLQGALATVEAEIIRLVLRRTQGNKTAAAELLGVSRNGLRIKMRRVGLACGKRSVQASESGSL